MLSSSMRLQPGPRSVAHSCVGVMMRSPRLDVKASEGGRVRFCIKTDTLREAQVRQAGQMQVRYRPRDASRKKQGAARWENRYLLTDVQPGVTLRGDQSGGKPYARKAAPCIGTRPSRFDMTPGLKTRGSIRSSWSALTYTNRTFTSGLRSWGAPGVRSVRGKGLVGGNEGLERGKEAGRIGVVGEAAKSV